MLGDDRGGRRRRRWARCRRRAAVPAPGHETRHQQSAYDDPSHPSPPRLLSSPMIDFDALASTPLQHSPYEWALTEQALDPARASAMIDTFPTQDFWQIAGHDGEKSYTYDARPLVIAGADRGPRLSPLSDAWQEAVDDLLSPRYREALGTRSAASLDDAVMEANVWRWPNAAHLGPHLDMRQKIVTHIFYLNAGWNPWWGGCLRILNSKDEEDVTAEIPPRLGNASILVRSDRSWHTVTPVTAAPVPRRSLIVTWFQPGSESNTWYEDEDGDGPHVRRASGRDPPRGAGAVGAGRARGARRRDRRPARRARRPQARPRRARRRARGRRGAPPRRRRLEPPGRQQPPHRGVVEPAALARERARPALARSRPGAPAPRRAWPRRRSPSPSPSNIAVALYASVTSTVGTPSATPKIAGCMRVLTSARWRADQLGAALRREVALGQPHLRGVRLRQPGDGRERDVAVVLEAAPRPPRPWNVESSVTPSPSPRRTSSPTSWASVATERSGSASAPSARSCGSCETTHAIPAAARARAPRRSRRTPRRPSPAAARGARRARARCGSTRARAARSPRRRAARCRGSRAPARAGTARWSARRSRSGSGARPGPPTRAGAPTGRSAPSRSRRPGTARRAPGRGSRRPPPVSQSRYSGIPGVTPASAASGGTSASSGYSSASRSHW